MELRTLADLELDGRTVLVRADLNVPLDGERITDASRLEAALPTVRRIVEAGAAVVLMSHLGRPGGQREEKYSLAPVARRLGDMLECEVPLAPDSVGEAAERAVAELAPGAVLLLENTRFHPGEKKNDPAYAQQLAALGDCFVNDAFGALHRAHASTVGVARLLPSAAGPLVEKEVAALERAIRDPARPYVVVLGGGKVADKLPLVERMLERADRVLIAGGPANVFLQARGMDIGDSLTVPEVLDTARRLLTLYGERLELPSDLRIAEEVREGAQTRDVAAGAAIPGGWRIVDVGPDTAARYIDCLKDARTIAWNGPLGIVEVRAFAEGTHRLAKALEGHPAYVVVGGGDTVGALHQAGCASGIDHVSTGGGASLAFLADQPLPGLEVLRRA